MLEVCAFFLALVLALLIAFIVSPYPAVLLIRIVFAYPTQSPSFEYEKVCSRISVDADVAYPSFASNNVTDIYIPKDRAMPKGTVIWMHGGAFVGGNKTDIRYFASSLAANGYAVLCPSYELAPGARYPTQLNQLHDICTFIEEDTEHTFNKENLIFAGDSAGAHLVSQFVIARTSENYADLIKVKASVPVERIKAVMLYCGPLNFERIGTSSNYFFNFFIHRAMWSYYGSKDWRKLYGQETTVKNYVTSDFPSTFITDGNHGSFERDAKELEMKLLDLGVRVDSYYVDVNKEKAGHEYQFNMQEPAAETAFEKTLCFLEKLNLNK